jgi:hypothetical protein
VQSRQLQRLIVRRDALTSSVRWQFRAVLAGQPLDVGGTRALLDRTNALLSQIDGL